jgi:hypothetical protein
MRPSIGKMAVVGLLLVGLMGGLRNSSKITEGGRP